MERFDSFLERFDGHVVRMDAHMEDTHEAIRESGIRFERAMQALDRRSAALEEESRAWRGRIEAQTEAIWKLLDRWGEGPPPEPAT